MLRVNRRVIKRCGKIVPFVFVLALLTTSGNKSWNTYVLALALTGVVGNRYWKDLKQDAEEKHLKSRLPDAFRNLNINAIKAIQEKTCADREFTFVVLGDSQRRHKVFRKVLQDASRHNPDFFIHTGDLTTGGRYHQYRESVEAISDFKTPIVFGMGNHDISHNGERFFSLMFGPQNFFFDVGGCRFIFINNNSEKVSCSIDSLPHSRNGDVYPNGIDEYTLESIEKLIAEKKNVFLVMHMPPPIGPFRLHGFHMNSSRFLALMEKYSDRVRSVFCGHIHGYAEIELNDIPYVITGGAGGPLRKNYDGIVARHHYVVVKAAGSSVTRHVHYVS
ncbi:MAG: hypothetical protein GF350_16235 [Chitinivibrionales bacterium]|nr:hypothetical protein [Chitinivibrionales bacterium]